MSFTATIPSIMSASTATKGRPRTTTDTIPGREGKNADMPYSLNVFTSPDGAEVVNANCLMCHGGKFDGQVVVGLGNATADFTGRLGGNSTGPLSPEILDLLGLTPAEKSNLNKMLGRAAKLAPATVMRNVGNNPAELYAVILMVHHDRDTLAWSDQPVTEIRPVDVDGSPIGRCRSSEAETRQSGAAI